MPDPRFDGSYDAPRFVDRPEVCSDCGQPPDHSNHDSRRGVIVTAGHFYNSGDPLIIERYAVPAVPHVSRGTPPTSAVCVG